MMTGGRRGKESGKEQRWGGKGRRGKTKTGGTDRVLVCMDHESWGVDLNARPVRQVVPLIFWPNMFEGLDRPNTPVGMVSPPSLATDDNSPLYEDEEEDWDKNGPLMNDDVVSIERMTVVQVSIWIKIDNNNDDNNL